MKCLNEFDLEPNYDEGYKLTLDEFALFKHLPVKILHLEALDLKRDNVDEFRRIMTGMTIRYISGFQGSLGDGLEISANRFGPDNRYVSI